MIRFCTENKDFKNLKIEMVQAGEYANTGERLRQIQDLIKTENLYCTYGDGLSNIEFDQVFKLHKENNCVATLCATHPTS